MHMRAQMVNIVVSIMQSNIAGEGKRACWQVIALDMGRTHLEHATITKDRW